MIWFFNQRVSEGYVLSAEGSRVLVIPMSDTDVEEKTEKDIIAALEDKDIQSQGTYYDIPLISEPLQLIAAQFDGASPSEP